MLQLAPLAPLGLVRQAAINGGPSGVALSKVVGDIGIQPFGEADRVGKEPAFAGQVLYQRKTDDDDDHDYICIMWLTCGLC